LDHGHQPKADRSHLIAVFTASATNPLPAIMKFCIALAALAAFVSGQQLPTAGVQTATSVPADETSQQHPVIDTTNDEHGGGRDDIGDKSGGDRPYAKGSGRGEYGNSYGNPGYGGQGEGGYGDYSGGNGGYGGGNGGHGGGRGGGFGGGYDQGKSYQGFRGAGSGGGYGGGYGGSGRGGYGGGGYGQGGRDYGGRGGFSQGFGGY
jgi:hypothetical protein